MKHCSLFVLFLILGKFFSACQFAQDENAVRVKLNLNREWKFIRADVPDGKDLTLDDKDWMDIHLPHSFSIPYFMGTHVYSGYGWYRKEINVPEEWLDKNVTLEFEGVFIETEVYVNGCYVGKHVGGYTGFYFDLSSYLKKGSNLIAVRVNNLWKPDVAPRTGDHQFSAGIYRDVYLNVTNKVHVDVYGTFVRTPQADKESAVCEMTLDVKNDNKEEKNVSVRTQIFNSDGTLVSQSASQVRLGGNTTTVVNQTFPEIKKPALWSPETPHLYKAVTILYAGVEEVDRYETTFGIRSFKWTADEGFFLNGEHYYLRGANVHQDQAGWGDAVTNKAMRRDVQMVKDAGFNCIRGSHYPHDPAFVQACDEIGLIFFSENAFWAMGGCTGDSFAYGLPPSSCYPVNPIYRDAFDRNVLTQLKEMIKIHRNSASVAAWSLCNEPFFTDPVTDEGMKNLLNVCTDSARIWDPSREVAIGGCQRKGIDKLGKGAIAFYNGGGEDFYRPGVPNLVSEYGSTVAERPGLFAPGWANIAEKVFEGGGDPWNPPTWRSGHIIWCGFDHGTIGGRRLATMGLIDYFRLPKRSYYWYQEAYKNGNHEPVEPQWAQEGTPACLKLEASSTVITSTDGTDDTQLIVSVLDASGNHISNNVPVTFSILSGPGEFPTGRSIQFMPPSTDEASDIQIRDGLAAIAFRSYHGGKTIIEASSPGLNSDTLVIETYGTPVWKEGVTQPVADRPYKRYTREMDENTMKSEMLLLGLNRPTWTSSDLEGYGKSGANDGNESTSWKPAVNDTERWWKLHLEAAYAVNAIQLELPEADKAYRYKIELSEDDVQWKEVVSEQSSANAYKIRTYRGNWGDNIAFVRITFLSEKAGIVEMKVGGK